MSAATLVRSVKQMPSGQTSSDRTKIATSEQIRIAQLISDKNEDSEALKSNIQTVMDVTGRPESIVIVALHDCDNDVQQAINQLLEGSTEQQGEWHQAGKKPKRQQHSHQPAGESHHTDDHNHHEEFYDAEAEGQHDSSLTRNSLVRGGFNGHVDQPPRFRGRGGGGRGGYSNGDHNGRGKENEPMGDHQGHQEGFERGRGRGRGGMTRPPRETSDRGRGRGRGVGVGAPRRVGRGDGDRGVRTSGVEAERGGFGRIDTWTNSNVVETNVWDNSMAKFVAKPAPAAESNTWDNSMADSVLKKDSRADTSADDWTGEDTDWSSSETRVFINQAAQKHQMPSTVQPQSQTTPPQPSQTAPGSLNFGRSPQAPMELNNFSHAGSQQHFHGHGEAIDVNRLFVKSTAPTDSATFNAQPPTSGSAWNRQASDTLKNELGIGKMSISTPGVDQMRPNTQQQQPSHTQSFRSDSLLHKTKTPVEMPDNLVGKVDVEFGNFGTLDPHHLSSDLSFSNSSNLTGNADRLSGSQPQRITNSSASMTYQRTPTKDQHLNGPSDYHSGSGSKDLGQKKNLIEGPVKSEGISGGYANAAQVFGKTDQSQQHYINSTVKSSVPTPQKTQSSVLSTIGDRGSSANYQPSSTGETIQTMKYTSSKLHQNLEQYDSSQPNLNSTSVSQGLHTKATVINNSNLQKQSTGSLPQQPQSQQQPTQNQQQQNLNQSAMAAAAAVASGFPTYSQQFAAQMNAAPYLASLYPMFRPEDYGLLQQQMMPNMFDMNMSSLGGQPSIIPSMSGGRDSAYSTGDMKISRSDGSTQAQSVTNSLAGAPPGPPGLTPTVSNAQTAAMLSQLSGFPYNINPYYYHPVAPPLMMQQQVANTAASNLLSGYQKQAGYPQGYPQGNTGYEESLSQDFSKVPTYGGMGQGQKSGQSNTGGSAGVNYSSGDMKSGYNAGMNKTLQQGFDSKSYASQQHSTVGTPPPFNNAQFQSAFAFQTNPQQAQAQFLTNPYFPMMHSPLAAQMQTHQTVAGENMGGTGGAQRGGAMQQQQQQQGKSVNAGSGNVGGANKPQNTGTSGFPPGFPSWSS